MAHVTVGTTSIASLVTAATSASWCYWELYTPRPKLPIRASDQTSRTATMRLSTPKTSVKEEPTKMMAVSLAL